MVEQSATKQDMDRVIDQVKDLLEQMKSRADRTKDQKRAEVSQVTGMLGMTPIGGVSMGRQCKKKRYNYWLIYW